MKSTLETEIRVGIFMCIGVGLLMATLVVLDGNKSFFSSKIRYTTHFSHVDGLIAGAKVILNGVPVGVVEDVELDYQTRDIRVHLSVDKEAQNWIREGSETQIETQGILGDKYIKIHCENKQGPLLPAGANLPSEPIQDFSQLVSRGDHLFQTLTSIATSLNQLLQSFTSHHRSETFFSDLAKVSENLAKLTIKANQGFDPNELKTSLVHLRQILEKIDNGTGSIGALINDPGVYDQLKAILGGANRNRIIRNLIRQTIRDSNEPAEHGH